MQRDRAVINRRLDRDLLDAMVWEPEASRFLARAVDQQGLTGRGWDRVRRVARTIADLAGVEVIAGDHVAEALTLRADP